jgi:shikimate kinase
MPNPWKCDREVEGTGFENRQRGNSFGGSNPLTSAMNKHILLIGMPGSGKSTVGKKLADALHYPFIDTDTLLEKKFQLSLEEIVEKFSLSEFIDHESSIIASALTGQTPSVISPGGSIAYSQHLRPAIKKSSYCIFLQVPITVLQLRIGDTPRGILKTKTNFEELYAERLPLYRQLSEYEIDGTQPVMALVDEICSLIYETKD